MLIQEGVKRVRDLQRQRLEILRKNEGRDSEEEEAHLEVMDEAWWACSPEERDYLNQEPGPHHEETVALINAAEGAP